MDKYSDEQLRVALERAQKDYDDVRTLSNNRPFSDDEALTFHMLEQFISDIKQELELRDYNAKAEIYREWKMKLLQTLPTITLPQQ